MAATPTLRGLRDVRPIGQGSFASVFRAVEDITYREVAVKVLRSEIDADLAERAFLTEAAVLGKIGTHPNVIDLFRAEHVAGGPSFLVMPFIDGGDLQTLIRSDGAIGWTRTARILQRILDALRFAHRNKVLHCDLKPANVLLTVDEVPVLIDFGVSRFVGAAMQPATSLGAWSFTAPECLAGEAPTAQSDLYAVGAIAHALLTGRPPVDLGRSTGPAEAASARRTAVVEALPGTVPAGAVAVLRSLIAITPDMRPVSADAALQELTPHIDPFASGLARAPITHGASASGNQWWRQT